MYFKIWNKDEIFKMFRITPHYLDVRTNKQKVVDKRISAKNVFLSTSRTVAVQNGQKVTKQSDIFRGQ